MTELDLAALSPEQKRALLAELLQRRSAPGEGAGELESIVPVPRGGELPLSYAQERLWFLHRLFPGSPLYNISLALRLTGPLEVEILRRSVRAVLERHEVLRTRFVEDGGLPRQIAEPVPEAPPAVLAVLDLSGVPEAEREDELQPCLIEDATRAFDLSRCPLLRLTLVRLGPEDHVIQLTMHHMVSDAWSVAIFAREVIALYEAFSAGAPSPLAPLPIQYADYARWQRESLSEDAREAELRFWRERLEGAPRLSLPTDRPRPAVPSAAGGRERLLLSAQRTAALRAFARAEGATTFAALLAAFDVVLARMCGEDEVVVGTPLSNRSRAELEPLIGVFVNTVVVRTSLAGDPSYRELVARVRSDVLAGTAHQRLPFEKLVEELSPERRLDATPLFQVLFVAPQGPARGIHFGERAATVLDLHSGTAKFDLTLAAVDRDERTGLYLEYRADLFDAATAQRILRQLDAALESMLADPDRPVSAASLVSAEERRRILVEWNATRVPEPFPGTVEEAVRAWAARTPATIAVTCGERRVSYAELERLVAGAAGRLRASGVAEGDVVAVVLPRSVELLVTALALWRIGAVYLPIECDHPRRRMELMLADAGARLVVNRADLIDGAGAGGSEPLAGDPGRLAYLIYTSGSTGRPKGVLVEHGSLARYLRWVDRTLLGERIDLLPAVTEPSFDASLKQLFAPLTAGREAWLVPAEVVRDPRRLLEHLSSRPDRRVAFNSVPSLWATLLDALDAGASPLPPLRALLLGGDHLTPRMLERTWRHFPGLEVWNLYGPTEATSNAAAGPVAPGEPITVGRPIDDAEVYVLDERLEPVPVGFPGRLHVGGANLARGYRNREPETRAAFLPSPFRPGERLYDSGDLARLLPDGRIRLLQRRDDQVKVRGTRVELGEVTAVLGEHPAIAEALVRAVGEEDDRRLVAYTVRRSGAEATAGQLRAFLAERLPSPMLPAAVLELESFPRLPSGKVDVHALPVPQRSRPASGRPLAPRSELEHRIAAVWRDVLEVEELGVEDNMFELGGHSLLLLRIQARLEAELGREIPVVDLFRYPTVASLAARLGAEATPEPDPSARIERMAEARHALARIRERAVADGR